LNLHQCLEFEYPQLVEAAKKISGNHELHLDLLHYGIEELSKKPNMKEIIESGGLRFYVVRIMMIQWRSKTGPFFKMYLNKSWSDPIDHLTEVEEEEVSIDIKKVDQLLDQLPWYDRSLFKLFADGGHTYSSLSRETQIPRTSISLTINRVRKHIKKNL
jgi:RNA polymerase sigma factor (sigma-70 family)